MSSLLVILFRVSPLEAPLLALPGLLVTTWLSVACLGSLVAYAIWARLSVEGMDTGKRVSASLREGACLASVAAILIGFLMMGILTWWIALLVALVFLLVEMAILS